MKIQIICRGMAKEGLGHLFRSRTFAETATRSHQVRVIAIAPQELRRVFAECNCPTQFIDHERDAAPLVREFGPDVLLFDLLSVDRHTFAELTAGVPLTGSISPIFDRMSEVDVVFCRSGLLERVDGPKIYTGLDYAIFGGHCDTIDDATYERSIAAKELSIAVCMGGTDAANKTLQVLNALSRLENRCTIWALLGEGYAHSYNALVDAVCSDRNHEIILARTNRSMWQIMGQCAIGILAGGLTTIEAIHAGLPTINISEKTEHSAMMEELFNMGVCVDGGPFQQQSLDDMVNLIRELNQNRERLQEIRNRSKGLIDMKGPSRVLSSIEREYRARNV